MLLLRLWKYLTGYVEIFVEGYFIERFINLCLNNGIPIWDVKRGKNSFLICKIGIQDYKKIRSIVKITKCRAKIKKKVGLPFVWKRYQKRKSFLVCLLVAILLIYAFNSFVWQIEIKGDFTMPIDEVYAQLEELGLKEGVLKNSLDLSKIKLKMSILRDDIAWIGIDIKGVKAIVEVSQKVEIPDIIPFDEPCHIVADKEGVITKIIAKNGIAMVKENEIVTKGQLLISGIITSNYAEDRFVHADGEIYLKTWYSDKIFVPFEKDLATKTGEVENKYQIKILNWEINLLNSDTKFEKYDKISTSNKLNIMDLFVLPIEVTKNTYEEINVDTVRYTKEQAEAIAKNEGMNQVMEKVPKESEVVNNIVNISPREDGVEVEIIVECIEKVGTNEKIGG